MHTLRNFHRACENFAYPTPCETLCKNFAPPTPFRTLCENQKTLCKNQKTLCHLFLNPRSLISLFLKHPYHCESLIFLYHLVTSSFSIRHPILSISLRRLALQAPFDMAWTQEALSTPSPSCTSRQRASSARVPHDSSSQAMEAPQIPPSKGGAPTSPSSPTPQRRYEMRKPPTTLGATTLWPESSVRHPPAKKVRTSGPGKSSRA